MTNDCNIQIFLVLVGHVWNTILGALPKRIRRIQALFEFLLVKIEKHINIHDHFWYTGENATYHATMSRFHSQQCGMQDNCQPDLVPMACSYDSLTVVGGPLSQSAKYFKLGSCWEHSAFSRVFRSLDRWTNIFWKGSASKETVVLCVGGVVKHD